MELRRAQQRQISLADTRELLRHTKERVLRGWTQEDGGMSFAPDGTRRLCLARAQSATRAALVKEGKYSSDNYRLSEEALQAAVGRRGYNGYNGLLRFNDAPQTTLADVVALIDEAIVSLSDSTTQPGAQRDPMGGAPGELCEAVPA